MTSIDSSTPAPVVDPTADSLHEKVWDRLEHMPRTAANIPVLCKLFLIMEGDAAPLSPSPSPPPSPPSTPAMVVNDKPKPTRGYKINLLRPFIDQVLLDPAHPTGRYTIDAILDALKKINCLQLVRDDNINRDNIRETVVKNSRSYAHDKIEKTFSLKRAMKPRVPRAT
jgi:hypothetical protein